CCSPTVVVNASSRTERSTADVVVDMVVLFLLLVLGCRSPLLLSSSLCICSPEPLQPCHLVLDHRLPPILGHRLRSSPLRRFLESLLGVSVNFSASH
ncbi:hypothetical protein SOVF_041300, partial [Spinacia oleracea]